MRNQELDKLALAQLLWRDEVLELMEYFDLTTGFRNASRKKLWRHVSNSLSLDEIKAFVCYKLRTRKNWRGKRQRVKPKAKKSLREVLAEIENATYKSAKNLVTAAATSSARLN